MVWSVVVDGPVCGFALGTAVVGLRVDGDGAGVMRDLLSLALLFLGPALRSGSATYRVVSPAALAWTRVSDSMTAGCSRARARDLVRIRAPLRL